MTRNRSVATPSTLVNEDSVTPRWSGATGAVAAALVMSFLTRLRWTTPSASPTTASEGGSIIAPWREMPRAIHSTEASSVAVSVAPPSGWNFHCGGGGVSEEVRRKCVREQEERESERV